MAVRGPSWLLGPLGPLLVMVMVAVPLLVVNLGMVHGWEERELGTVALAGGITPPGVINLDEHTFDKVVGADVDVLVKFDWAYSHGELEDAFRTVAIQLAPTSVLVAQVSFAHGVGPNDADMNRNVNRLVQRFQLNTEAFPSFYVLPKGSRPPLNLTDDVSVEALLRLVQAGTAQWLALPGCIQPLDELAKRVAQGILSPIAALAELETLDESTVQSPQAIVYRQILTRLAAQGPTFVARELARVQRLLRGRSTPAQPERFQQRLNVLCSFLAAPTTGVP
ncbi:uncharacterized protein MONBRDRAFT_30030 [Monosiga brevicollis MX1]|uniref:Uncharacterized protein n=1 Tax=Monosiga brevicollis TaxID=81824 RepID=A9VCT6_MONBE|nr:uncharacterized protein MONBRDRAFT_30030 [Monosiga brevicollis MX1]EDQ84651.1 predicted protein [Monosiga brevicollis MX1]|eukprot:XP_001750555.1 hypothetical protein [Monosiga brevicollis MX1]